MPVPGYSDSLFSLRATLARFAVLLAMASVAQAQTQASCTFTMLDLPGPSTSINDFGTIVGGAGTKGYIRYAGGGVTYYSVPSASSTSFNDRNNNGVSVGTYLSPGSQLPKGFMLDGSTPTSVVPPGATQGTYIGRINKWSSIIGYYGTAQLHGFKRYSNGSFITLDFPGAASTTPTGQNDNGMVVGSVVGLKGSVAVNGFVYYKGQWATLNYPNAVITEPWGISNSGAIIGNAELFGMGAKVPFLYQNGTFKFISVPNAQANSTFVWGISSRQGIILGTVSLSTGGKSFIAKCN
ncbi:MAG TPA: hypothetical protein VN708_13335 [Terriglobales bacterium]|jgi:hypothetical protein|nr:hypothetical protein [Terriglobales bacterium]